MAKPTSTKRDELARSEPKNLATSAIPEYLRKAPRTAAAGLENVEQRDMTLPRLGLCQSMSPQRTKSDVKYIHGLEEGMYFNTITGRIYGESVLIVPLLMYKTRILFNPIDEGGGIRCQAQDARHGVGDPSGDCERCPFGQFKDQQRPECDLFYNYASLAFAEDDADGLDASSIVVVSLKSTGIKVAKDWNALMRLRGTDSFAGLYEFSAAEQKKDNQRWFQSTIKNVGWVSEAQYRLAQGCYQMVKEAQLAGRLKTDENDDAGMGHEEPEPTTPPKASGKREKAPF